MEIVSDRKKVNEEFPQKVQIQFHGFGEKSRSFTIKGMSAEEAFNRTLQYWKAVNDSEDGFVEIKAFKARKE